MDFLVIGAQKAGTTSLWQYLREHRRLRFPRTKEVPVLIRGAPTRAEIAAGILRRFGDVRPDSLLGTVTPEYMIGKAIDNDGERVEGGGDVGLVARRIKQAFPQVKLIALLRDPIERAISNYIMTVRRGQEKRELDDALSRLLDPVRLKSARRQPTDSDMLIVAGEYGRILGTYRDLFPADQLLVQFSADLIRDPGSVIDEILVYLGLPTGFRPAGLGIRHFRGGKRKLLDGQAEEALFRYFREELLPYMSGDQKAHERAFEFFYITWNVAPDHERPQLSADVRMRLEEHYRDDADKLTGLGIPVPWIQQWEAGR